jgi:hypothetical protein
LRFKRIIFRSSESPSNRLDQLEPIEILPAVPVDLTKVKIEIGYKLQHSSYGSGSIVEHPMIKAERTFR